MIYFIEYAGRIKVGYAANVDRRLSEFKTVMPLFTRLGSMEGNRGHERTIHNFLAEYREGGEWFKDCPEVRLFLTRAMIDGVEEWISKHRSHHVPTMWDVRAKKLGEIICADKPKGELRKIERELSLPSGCLWNVRYRQRREVSVGEYFAILTAARETIKRQQDELDRAKAFVSDLEREDADSTNRTFDVEKQMAAYRASVGEGKD